MKKFREFCDDSIVQEGLIQKGAVTSFASQGKRHGDEAARHYREAKRFLTKKTIEGSSDEKIKDIASAFDHLLDGLISSRLQIGSVSAQVTSLSLL
jgi:hypothetical protein